MTQALFSPVSKLIHDANQDVEMSTLLFLLKQMKKKMEFHESSQVDLEPQRARTELMPGNPDIIYRHYRLLRNIFVGECQRASLQGPSFSQLETEQIKTSASGPTDEYDKGLKYRMISCNETSFESKA
jgi:hypothetical protein